MMRRTLHRFRDQILPLWCWLYPAMTWGGKIDRRFQAFGVGLSKTGTHSLAAALGDACRSAHEIDRAPLRRSLTCMRQGRAEKTISRLLIARDRKLNLELQVDHVLGTMISPLYRAFPDAKYILTVRDARSWLQSEISQRLVVRLPALESFRYDCGYTFTPHDERLKQLDAFPLEAYLAYWRRHNHQILGLIPPEQLLVIRTDEITPRIGEIASWLGLENFHADPEKTRQYVRKEKVNLGEFVDEGYLTEQIELHCASLEALLGLR